MKLNMIVCVADNNLIGDAKPTGNGLLWHSKEELQYFKSLTVGNVVVFGANTSKFVPIELMKKDRDVEIIEFGKRSLSVDIIPKYWKTDKDVFVCGGYTVYKTHLNSMIFDNIYLSKLKPHVAVKQAIEPLYLPDIDSMPEYVKVSETEHEDFIAYVYKRKK